MHNCGASEVTRAILSYCNTSVDSWRRICRIQHLYADPGTSIYRDFTYTKLLLRRAPLFWYHSSFHRAQADGNAGIAPSAGSAKANRARPEGDQHRGACAGLDSRVNRLGRDTRAPAAVNSGSKGSELAPGSIKGTLLRIESPPAGCTGAR